MISKYTDQEIIDFYSQHPQVEIASLGISGSRFRTALTNTGYIKPKELEEKHLCSYNQRKREKRKLRSKELLESGAYTKTLKQKQQLSISVKAAISSGKFVPYFCSLTTEENNAICATPELKARRAEASRRNGIEKRLQREEEMRQLRALDLSVPEISEIVQVGEPWIRSLCRRASVLPADLMTDSPLEAEFWRLFPEFATQQTLWGRQPQGTLDFYSSEHKLAVEINGCYWHSSLRKEHKAHQDFSLKCRAEGIRLIHIYEHEWIYKKEIIISLVESALGKYANRYQARKLTLKNVSPIQAREFLNTNHLQGYRAARVCIGLYDEEELIQLMSFGFNHKYESWEIFRSATKLKSQVIGGISKLLSYFVSTCNPTKLVSYCDFNKFDGKGYKAMGFSEVMMTAPDMHWILDMKEAIVVNRNPSKHKELKSIAVAQLFGSGNILYKKEW